MRIIFVCTGNTCRSPMAAGIAKKLCLQNCEILSAGINALEGNQSNPKANLVMKEKGIDISDHRAVTMNQALADSADQIITMTKHQADFLISLYPDCKEKIKRLGDWIGIDKDIVDPWGGDVDTYFQCAQELEKMIKIFFQKYYQQK